MNAPTQATPANEIDLAITGMTCDGCANALTRALSRVDGVTRVAVDFAAGRAHVAGSANTDRLVAAVEKAGYGATRASDGAR